VLSCTAVNDSATTLPAPETPTARRFSSRWRRDLLFFSIAAAIVCADQLTKWLVRSHLALYEQWPDHSILGFRIIHVVNSGAAFGILQGQTPFLIVTSLLGLGAIVMYYLYPPMEHGLIRVALGMQLGGAIGNFIDRVRVGEVTDFIDVGRFPTFNIADSSISVSIVAVLIFFALQETEEGRKKAASPPVDANSTPTHED
jgi:signal peptidase II